MCIFHNFCSPAHVKFTSNVFIMRMEEHEESDHFQQQQNQKLANFYTTVKIRQGLRELVQGYHLDNANKDDYVWDCFENLQTCGEHSQSESISIFEQSRIHVQTNPGPATVFTYKSHAPSTPRYRSTLLMFTTSCPLVEEELLLCTCVHSLS